NQSAPRSGDRAGQIDRTRISGSRVVLRDSWSTMSPLGAGLDTIGRADRGVSAAAPVSGDSEGNDAAHATERTDGSARGSNPARAGHAQGVPRSAPAGQVRLAHGARERG